MTGTINEGNVSEQVHFPAAIAAFTRRIVFLVGGKGFVAAWTGTCRVIAFVDLHPNRLDRLGSVVESKSGGEVAFAFA